MHPDLYLDHIVLRVRNVAETQMFWDALLGEPASKSEESLMYMVGPTRLFFTSSPCESANVYDKERIGLNHLAFGVRSSKELRNMVEYLDYAGLENSGVRIDRYGQKEFVWMDDPNGFRVEFYCRPE